MPEHLDVVVLLGDGAERLQREATGEDRGRAQDVAFVLVEEVVGPGDRVPECRLAIRPELGAVNNRIRSVSRSRTSVALIAAIRAAASSMPRGRPSSVRQISITAAAVCSSWMAYSGRAAPAR